MNQLTTTVSVIIPTLNEQEHIARCIESVAGQPVTEIIVCDGGSTDETMAIAHSLGVNIIRAPRGRALQMNAGATASVGDVLLFLHADCTLAPGAIESLHRQATEGQYVAGYFRQRIDGRHPLYRLIELGSRWRAKWLKRPYGDQAMFFDRSTFEQIGGFPDAPVLEDLLIARAVRRFGPMLALPQRVTCSPRRWEHDGIVRRILRNWAVALAELRGTPHARLLQRYESVPTPLFPPLPREDQGGSEPVGV